MEIGDSEIGLLRRLDNFMKDFPEREPHRNRTEQGEKPEWFRRFICFGIEKNSEKYLIVPFAGIEINKKYVIRC